MSFSVAFALLHAELIALADRSSVVIQLLRRRHVSDLAADGKFESSTVSNLEKAWCLLCFLVNVLLCANRVLSKLAIRLGLD